ncbi:uncharacterized protein LOC126997822 [Eriocheir sinensis]|uniref:uncharacterized protein LOC126997822 n=1 Tax=Eriocheir sinensis TaxID=95602 RepID=UPI0021C7F27B|nr:uncharacterized protein LOC126997822 [Eriocheir sinensis]
MVTVRTGLTSCMGIAIVVKTEATLLVAIEEPRGEAAQVRGVGEELSGLQEMWRLFNKLPGWRHALQTQQKKGDDILESFRRRVDMRRPAVTRQVLFVTFCWGSKSTEEYLPT